MTSIKLLLTIVVMVACQAIYGQNVVTDTSATVVSYWQKGDVAKYTLDTD